MDDLSYPLSHIIERVRRGGNKPHLQCWHVSTLALFAMFILSVPRPACWLFPSGLQWLFSSCLCVRRKVVITLFRYLGPQWNHCSAQAIKHFLLNGRIALQTLKMFATNFYSASLFLRSFEEAAISDFCLFVFSSFYVHLDWGDTVQMRCSKGCSSLSLVLALTNAFDLIHIISDFTAVEVLPVCYCSFWPSSQSCAFIPVAKFN